MPQKVFPKKIKILSFFIKGGLEGQKIKILKKYFQNRKELQKLDIKHVLHSPKEEKKIKKVFVMDERIDIQITLYIDK